MPAAPLPSNEISRLRALLELDVLDSPAEPEFDALVQAAALICGVPISLISLVDAERQWFKANIGFHGATETPRDMGFCAHAIHDESILEVYDATRDPRFADSPLVTGEPNIRFYAGAPLLLSNGANIGNLCVVDTQPHQLNEHQRTTLTLLAKVVVKALESRRSLLLQNSTSKQVIALSEQISKSEARFRALSDTSPFGVFETDLNGKWIYTNPRWQQIYDLTFDESLGDGWQKGVHPEDMEQVDTDWKTNAFKAVEFGISFRVQHKNGAIRRVIARAKPLKNEAGEMLGWVGSIEDVTDFENAIDQLAKGEARYRSLYESTPTMMHSINNKGCIINVSNHWLAVLGYVRQEVIGKPYVYFLTEKSAEYVQNIVLPQFYQTGHCDNIEYQMITKQGCIIDVLLAATLEANSDGTPARMLAVLQDITLQKAAVRTNEAWLGTIRSQYIMSATNPQGDIIEINDAFCAISQYSREELLGKNHRLVNSTFHPKAFFSDMWQTIRNGKPWRGDICNRSKDGNLYWVDSLIVPFLDSSGEVERYISIRSDITSRKQAETNLLAEQKTLAAIIEGTGAGSWEWNVQTGHTRFNEQWAKILGYRLEELSPVSINTWRELTHPDDLIVADRLIKRHLCGESPRYECEFRIRNCYGQWVWVLARGKLLSHTPTGEPEWMFGTQLDINLRKQQEEALRKNQALLNRTGQIAGIGGWEVDLESGVIFWSDETRRIHGVDSGYKPDIAKAINFYAPEAQPIIQAAVERAMATGEGWDLELPFIQQSGQHIWVRAVGSVEFEHDRPVRIVGAFQNITERINQSKAIVEAHERMALATDSGQIGVWELDVVTGNLTWDAWMYRLYGLTEDNHLQAYELWTRHLHPEDKKTAESALEMAIKGIKEFNTEFRIVWGDGSIHHLRASARVIRDQQGNAVKMVGVNWDVSPLRLLAAQLSDQHELLRVTLKSIGDAVITTDAQGNITWLNPIAERMTGWASNDAKGRELTQVFHILNENTRLKTENSLATCLAQGKTVAQANTVLISCTGDEFGIEDSASPIRNEKGELLGAVLVFHDVTEQRRLIGEVSYQATHDALTGLLNRTEFETRLRRLLHKAHEEKSSHALMYLDLDQFKIVNDTCGHTEGDQLLLQVSKLFGDTVRTRDTLARLGGDEFGVILEYCTTEQAQRVAQEICDKMESFRFMHDEHRFRVGASIGLVTIDDRWPTTAVLMQAADTSCYAAKEAGRNRVHTWYDTDQTMRARHGEMQWTTRIEQALDDNRFVLYAQRIESIQTEAKGMHAEILLRMLDADGDIIAPGAFLPAAERYHLASRIDRWVLANTIAWLNAAPSELELEMLCINLSGQSIGDRAFHRQAVEMLSGAGEKICHLICLEVTETAAITNLADAALFIEQVSSLGIRVALDDFGAGASSFGYLKNLQVDILKIDGQFIKDLLDDPLDDAAVRCFVDVAKVVKVKTVAEFVDKPEILKRVRELGIDYAQGFLLHKPEPLSTMFKITTKQKNAAGKILN
jgi:diguanylate cyclase (GGDEF)-like protein/PAS domain S-box-containing protein